MTLRKTVAFLIALSMLVGLVCFVPVWALSPVTGYAKEVIIDEHFSGSYDTNYLTVSNGTVSDGVLGFTLTGESYMAVSADIDTTVNRQYMVNFHLSTTASYTNPFTATFIGLRMAKTDLAPYDNINGAWVGITKDKLILWYSYKNSLWDKAAAEEGVHYALIDAPVSLEEADYRIIYDGTTVELAYMEGATAKTLLTLTVNSEKYVTMTDGAVSLTSPIAFAEEQTEHYFGLYNHKKIKTVVEDPLSPRDDWGAGEDEEEETGEPAFITVDDVVFTVYTGALMTSAQRTKLSEMKEAYQAILNACGTDGAVYLDNSVDESALQDVIKAIDDTLKEEELLSTEAAERLNEYAKATEEFVEKGRAEGYLLQLDAFSQLIADAKEQVENGEANYNMAALNKVAAQIQTAKELVDKDGLRASQLTGAYESLMRAIGNLNIYVEDGIPVYTQSFTAGLSYDAFEGDWTQQGESVAKLPVTTKYGIPVNLWQKVVIADQGIDTGSSYRYQMILNNTYDAYAVKATLTKETSGGYASMVLRVNTTTNIHEEDRQSPIMLAGYQTGSIVIGTPGGTSNFKTLMIAVEDGAFVMNKTPGARVATTVDMTSLGVLTNGNKTCTIMAKDFGELVEVYALSEDGDKVKLATIVFTGQSSGTLTNEISGSVQNFTGMNINSAASGHIGFGARSALMYIKDFTVSKNILPASELLVNQGDSEPTSFSLAIDNNDLFIDGGTGFSVLASFDKLKVIGKNEYKEGTIDVSRQSNYTTTMDNAVITVDGDEGVIKGVGRGSDILTVSYESGDAIYTDKALLTVDEAGYTAPQETDVFGSRIVSAVIENSDVFKSLDEGLSAIPVIRYTYPNGSEGILPSNIYADYCSTDETVIAYNRAKGRYETKGRGMAKIYAVVYDAVGTTTTPKVNVEVTEKGTMDLGASYTVAAHDLWETANKKGVTVQDMWDAVDEAVSAGMDVPVGDDDGILLLISALKTLENTPSTAQIANTCVLLSDVHYVYDMVQSKYASADDLAGYLFGKASGCEIFGIDKSLYTALSKNKQSQLITRLFTQLARQKTALTVSSIKETFDTIYDLVVNAGSGGGGGGGGGKDTVTQKTNSGLGNTGFIGGTTPVKPEKQPLTSEEIASAVAVFSDIDDAPWAKEIIATLVYDGVITGYEDATIRPNSIITRDEFTKLLVGVLGIDTNFASATVYSDVPYGSWQEPFVAAAVRAGLVQGLDAYTFGVGKTISRQDMALMIYRAILKNNITLPSGQSVAFRDSDFIAAYAKDAVAQLAAAGIISGMGDGTFAPVSGATRAQAFAMLYALEQLKN